MVSVKDFLGPYPGSYPAHRKHRAKENRRKNRSIKENKQAFKRNEKQVKKYEKDINKFHKKFGDESFKNYDALSPEQKKVHNKLLSRAQKGLDRSERGFAKAEQKFDKAERKIAKHTALPKEKKLPGMAKLRGIPELQKLSKNEGYNKGKSYLSDLLSGDSETYKRFAAPMEREFERKILPKIANQYAGEGYNSAARGELFEAGNDLQERLGRLRGELQLGAIDPNLRYTQANQENQQQRIQNRFGENAQRSGVNLERYNRARQSNQDLLSRNQTQYGRANDLYNRAGQGYGRVQNEYNRAVSEGDIGLRTNPYHSIYRSPSPPALPAEYAQGQTYQPQPSALQRGFQAAAPALGTAFGGAAGGAVGAAAGSAFGQGFAGAAGSNPVQQQASSYGRTNPAPAPQVPQSTFRNYQPNWNSKGPAGTY